VRESDRATKLGHQKNLIVRGRESLRRKLIELNVRGREGLRRKLSRVLIYLRERETGVRVRKYIISWHRSFHSIAYEYFIPSVNSKESTTLVSSIFFFWMNSFIHFHTWVVGL
jgi:hypothetical protein